MKANSRAQFEEEKYAAMLDKAMREIESGKVKTNGESEFRKAVRGSNGS